jgi:sigma-B regulation protein RsbU (phosphoserine phosphatase)
VLLHRLLQEYRTHRVARFTAWLLAYGLALWLMDRLTHATPQPLWTLFWAAAVPSTAYYFYRSLKFTRQRLLWRLRWRLMVTYLFIAVIPIGLIALLILFGGVILGGQFASFLVTSNLRSRAAELQGLSRVIAHEGDFFAATSREALLERLQHSVTDNLSPHLASYPALEVTLWLAGTARAFRVDGQGESNSVRIPPWLAGREGFAGVVVDQGRLVLRGFDRSATHLGPLTVILSEPFTPELLDEIAAGIGPVALIAPENNPLQSGSAGDASRPGLRGAVRLRSASVAVPPPANLFDATISNLASLEPVDWGGPTERRDTGAGLFLVTSRISALNREILSTLGPLSGFYWTALAVVGVVFLLLEIVSLIIGVKLTRSMTTTVDKLYTATEHVKRGDFSYRIRLPARDQLSALGEAFDSMTASVERLLRESLEKTRLEGELEIAREVQSQLFPQAVPLVPGLQLYGACRPARVVSGDYYDFLRLDEDRVGLVLGDISGKGISAALLMATLQSALHAQFYDGDCPHGPSESGLARTAEVVARLNRQLFASSPTEKYVTLFYAVYEAASRRLTYTNAGHPPPILFRRGRLERLETGGTVVGLFPSIRYEQAEVRLEPEDVLLAFTDGITEPENSYGEEFGDERLLAAVESVASASPEIIAEEIYRRVNDWTGGPELQDDMTLLVARVVRREDGHPAPVEIPGSPRAAG